MNSIHDWNGVFSALFLALLESSNPAASTLSMRDTAEEHIITTAQSDDILFEVFLRFEAEICAHHAFCALKPIILFHCLFQK